MPAVEVFYDNDMGDPTLDVSATTRKFQTSMVIKQDSEKSGILSFLENIEKETPSLPIRVAAQTQRPTSIYGNT